MVQFQLKGAVSIIQGVQDGNARLKTKQPQDLCLIKYKLNINNHNFGKGLFSIVVSLSNRLAHLCYMKQFRNYQNKTLKPRKTEISSTSLIR